MHPDFDEIKCYNTAFTLQRVEVHGHTLALLGRAHRHPITGEVYLWHADPWCDFHLVDLYTRSDSGQAWEEHFQAGIAGTPYDLCTDKYLFKAVPMKTRTWIYHSIYRRQMEDGTVSGTSDLGIAEALATRCIDADVNAGDRSPVMCLAPGLFLSLLTADFMVSMFGLFTFMVCLFFSIKLNNAQWRNVCRPISLSVRVPFMILTLVRSLSAGDVVSLFGYLSLAGVVAFDIATGDWMEYHFLTANCHYEVLRQLPNQVFVCRQVGDSHREVNRPVWEGLTGSAEDVQIRARILMIANIHGVLVKLVPLEPSDGFAMHEEYSDACASYSGEKFIMRYFGADVFNDMAPDCGALDKKDQAFEESMATVKRELENLKVEDY